jgi:hypothetical protein
MLSCYDQIQPDLHIFLFNVVVVHLLNFIMGLMLSVTLCSKVIKWLKLNYTLGTTVNWTKQTDSPSGEYKNHKINMQKRQKKDNLIFFPQKWSILITFS